MNTLEAFSTERLIMDLRAAFVRRDEAQSLIEFYAALQTLFADNVLIRYELLNYDNRFPAPNGWEITIYTPQHAVSVSGMMAASYLSNSDYAQHTASKLAQRLGRCVFLRDNCQDG